MNGGFVLSAHGTRSAAAVISPCGEYRYSLHRRWGGREPIVNWIMLNPSTADGAIDDATLRRCLGYSKSWGFGGLVVTNLFAFRSTDPGRLRRATDPIGPLNDDSIREQAKAADRVVLGWGSNGSLLGRDRVVLGLLRDMGIVPQAIRLTAGGHPCHPLRLPAELTPFPFDQAEEGEVGP